MLIKNISADKIAILVHRGLVNPEDAIKAFPSNNRIIKSADRQGTRLLDTQNELINFINSSSVDPHEAVKLCPNNVEIVEAAYKKDPTSIKHASVSAINELGTVGKIEIADVLHAFSKQMPKEPEIQGNKAQFAAAMAHKDWATVSAMCNTFWFEKPAEATVETVTQHLSQRREWEDLYEFCQAAKKENYTLTEGPLIKSEETTQLEALCRRMMQDGLFVIKNKGGDDYFIFRDGEQFNWTKIQAHANLQHVDLSEVDFAAYKKYMASKNAYVKSPLLEVNEDLYREQLYKDPISGAELERPIPPISFEEMQAINIYSGDFYKQMNGLMRDEQHRLDYRVDDHSIIRAALIQSVIAASGLRKVPMTDIPQSFRGIDYDSDKKQQERIEAVAKQGVITLDGFVSTSIEKAPAFITP